MTHDDNALSPSPKCYVDAAKFEAVILSHPSLQVSAQAGFIKVSGSRGHNVYVARTKMVGRVDVSGFLFDGEGLVTLSDREAFGKVTQQLDFLRDEASILGAFDALLAHLASLPAKEKPARAPRITAEKPAGWSEAVAPKETDEEAAKRKAARRALIEKTAREMGVGVSDKAAA